MPKNINLKIDQTTYEIIILQNKIPYISRGLKFMVNLLKDGVEDIPACPVADAFMSGKKYMTICQINHGQDKIRVSFVENHEIPENI